METESQADSASNLIRTLEVECADDLSKLAWEARYIAASRGLPRPIHLHFGFDLRPFGQLKEICSTSKQLEWLFLKIWLELLLYLALSIIVYNMVHTWWFHLLIMLSTPLFPVTLEDRVWCYFIVKYRRPRLSLHTPGRPFPLAQSKSLYASPAGQLLNSTEFPILT